MTGSNSAFLQTERPELFAEAVRGNQIEFVNLVVNPLD